MRLLGVILAYNEADLIGRAVERLIASGHDVRVYDHGSTDRTAAIAARAGAQVTTLPRSNIDFSRAWAIVSGKVMASTYDWVTWLAADEVLRDPRGSIVSREAILEASASHDVIRPLVREFWMTDADPPPATVPDHERRLQYYRFRHDLVAPRSWRRTLTGRMPYGLHREDAAWHARVCRNTWTLDHYPIRTQEQGRSKVDARPKQPLYRPFQNGRSLIRDHHELWTLAAAGRG